MTDRYRIVIADDVFTKLDEIFDYIKNEHRRPIGEGHLLA